MDDVARASGLGRRTIYTYFKSREELLQEVIKEESALIITNFNLLVEQELSPEKKINRFMLAHMKTVENLIRRNQILRIEFLHRSERIEQYRVLIDQYEKQCIASIMKEGGELGVFLFDDYETMAELVVTTLKGFERQFILNDFGDPCHKILLLWHKIFIRGIKTSV